MIRKISIWAVLSLLLFPANAGGQLAAPDFKGRSDDFVNRIGQGTAILFSSASRGAGNNNFYYLTGERAPGWLVVSGSHLAGNTVLLKEPDLTNPDAYSSVTDILRGYLSGTDVVWAETADTQRVRKLLDLVGPGKEIRICDRLFYQMREIKDDYELATLARAIEITAETYNHILRILRPGLTEMQVIDIFRNWQAELGADGTSFIQAGSGVNGTQVHARASEKIIEKGDLVVFDVGAWYKGYTSDISRTFPASGRFTRPQKQIYQLVLDAQKAAIERMVPGTVMREVQLVAENTLLEGLLKLGLITDIRSPWQRSLYIVHGFYHYIGLEVHDLYTFMSPETATKTYQPGMIMTMEPGLYFRPDLLDRKPPRARDLSDEEWAAFVKATRKNFLKYVNIGVRIEDDVLITPEGNSIMSSKVPKEIKEIERAMRR